MPWSFTPDRPIYTQLMERLYRAIAAGEYPPGSRLPAVRELAATAGINPNTVQRALTELEREGLIFSQRTAGRFVTEDASVVDGARKQLAERQIQQFLSSMAQLGYTAQQAAALLGQQKEED